jgi:single-strand DNA-binding protein
LAVHGRIQTRNYENNDGKKVYITEVVADEIQFLEKKNSTDNAVTSSNSGNAHKSNDYDNDMALVDSSDIPF